MADLSVGKVIKVKRPKAARPGPIIVDTFADYRLMTDTLGKLNVRNIGPWTMERNKGGIEEDIRKWNLNRKYRTIEQLIVDIEYDCCNYTQMIRISN